MNFVIDVANHIVDVILLIGQKNCLNTKQQPGSTPSLEKTPSLIVRKPPMGWAEYRCRIVKAAEQARPPSPAEELSTNSNISK